MIWQANMDSRHKVDCCMQALYRCQMLLAMTDCASHGIANVCQAVSAMAHPAHVMKAGLMKTSVQTKTGLYSCWSHKVKALTILKSDATM